MLPRRPVVISNSTWSRIRSDSKSRIRSSRRNSLHSSRGKTLKKTRQTETCRYESRGRENLPARNRARESPPGVKAAATETAAMGLGSSSGDHGSKGNHNYGCIFNNLRVM
jgi:hypothetical protein